MASSENHKIRVSPTARTCQRCAVVVSAVFLLVVPIVGAQPSTLIANPAGSLSIDGSKLPQNEQLDLNQVLFGPPSVTQAEITTAQESGTAVSDSESAPAPQQTHAASKPLGMQVSPGAIETESGTPSNTPGASWGLRTALALASVIGLILLCKFAFVRMASRGGGSIAAQLGPSGRAPSGLLSVLARYPIAKGSTLVLLRLDRRVLLLSQTGQGFTTLSEIDDPEEVAALIMRAEDEEGASLTRRFRTMLTQAERDPELIGEREFEIETAAAMTPRTATARFHDLAMDERVTEETDPQDNADAVGSLRDRLRSLREVTA